MYVIRNKTFIIQEKEGELGRCSSIRNIQVGLKVNRN